MYLLKSVINSSFLSPYLQMLECPRALSLNSSFFSAVISKMISSNLMVLNPILILMTPRFISVHGTSFLSFRTIYSTARLLLLLCLICISILTCFFFSTLFLFDSFVIPVFPSNIFKLYILFLFF